MDNRGLMSSLLAIGAAGVAIYGISKGVQNGTFQKMMRIQHRSNQSPKVETGTGQQLVQVGK